LICSATPSEEDAPHKRELKEKGIGKKTLYVKPFWNQCERKRENHETMPFGREDSSAYDTQARFLSDLLFFGEA